MREPSYTVIKMEEGVGRFEKDWDAGNSYKKTVCP